SPGLNSIKVFTFPFCSKIIQSLFCSLFVWGGVDVFHVGGKFFSVFPNYIFASVSNLMNYAYLGLRLLRQFEQALGSGKTERIVLVKPLRLSVAVIKISSTPRAFKSVKTFIQKLELSFFPSHIPRLPSFHHDLNQRLNKRFY